MRKFIRTRTASPPPPPHAPARHKTNGHANGEAGGRGSGGGGAGDASTLSSRYWSGSERSPGGAGALWEDPEFAADSRALGGRRCHGRVVWMRPHELCARATFRGDSRDDGAGEPDNRWRVVAGSLGGAHVCVAAAALAHTPRLLDRVVPPQPRAASDGRYRFRFWEFGAWRDVCVDDRLPTRDGRLLASRSAAPDDFTLPLLEKAYAKLYGSYAALRGGRGGGGRGGGVARALQDLTGGVVQSFELARQPAALTLRVLEAGVPRSTLLVAWSVYEPTRTLLVTGLARVRGGAPLVRLRAADAGGGAAGGGAAWGALSPQDRELLAARAEPGDFWLSFAEFGRALTRLELVHVGPDDWMSEPALRARRPWRAVLARRRWRPGFNAGGPPSADTADSNPQFHVQIPAGAGAGAGAEGGGRCHVVVSVTQRYAAAERRPPHAIGFSVYALAPDAPRGPAGGAARARRALDAAHESRAREVAAFFTLPAGRYLVVPHTRRAHVDAAFLLRILTDERADVWEVNDDNWVVRGAAAELAEAAAALPARERAAAARAAAACARDGELDARALRAALRRVWRSCLAARPSAELCRALVALGEAAPAGRGALPAGALPALVALLAGWRRAWRAAGGAGRAGGGLRALLAACGVRASNKVLEALVVRFARGASLDHEAFLLALARLHLAHGRWRALDARLKANPVSLEEMILMTIYT